MIPLLVDYSLRTVHARGRNVPWMFGDILRALREDAGLTQEELAARARIHRTYVSLLERDKKSPTLDVLFRICAAIGVNASEFIARVEQGK